MIVNNIFDKFVRDFLYNAAAACDRQAKTINLEERSCGDLF